MVAVRALLSTLNGIAQAGLLAGSRMWPADTPGGGGAAGAADASEPWDEGAYAHAGDEPLLEDLLRDPVVHLVMRADRLEPAQVRRLLRPKPPPAAF
jgi:hypothetical protein